MTFKHNGKPFDDKDVRAITGIGSGTKKDNVDTIGRFGIGFKAVFAYTETPRIWSLSYAFEISDRVLPSEIRPSPDLGDHTRFEFPFNNAKKPQAQAFPEVRDGLREISDNTLLFLSNIEEIRWCIDGGREGRLLRIPHSDHHIEVLKETNGATTASSHYLRFTRPVEGPARQTQHKMAAAFALEFLPDVKAFDQNVPIAKQMKIAPVQGQVAVFFPAEKETSGLRFHLHAPFVPELSRSSIKDTPANLPLFEKLAELCAASLRDIKELGFLGRDFLGVLPNAQDTLGKRYEQIRDAIIHAFNEEPLMPTFARGHAPAKYLYQAKESLKKLLSVEDIEFLIEHHEVPPQWAANRKLQGTNAERFMSGLAIRDWDVNDFLEALAENTKEGWRGPDEDFMAWLSAKPVEWLQRMYAMLVQEQETKNNLGQLSNARIIRLKDGSFSSADKCYLPDEQRRFTDMVPCVDHDILEAGNSKAQKKAARDFLEVLGVKEIGERQLVEALLDKEYNSADHPLKEKAYPSHLQRFMKLADDDPSASCMLRNYSLFLGMDWKWHSASQIYLDRPYTETETGMSDYYDIVGLPKGVSALAEFYKDMPIDTSKIVRFVESLGAREHIPISKAGCQNNPEWEYLCRVPGERYTFRSDEDYRIEHFKNLVAARNARISRLIWNTMCKRGGVLRAQFRKNRSGGTRDAPSQVVHQLRKAEWVPQGDRFVRPASARAELLPPGFTFDSGWAWIKAIEFGKEVEFENEKAKAAATEAVEKCNRRNAAAAELGFEPDDVAWLEKLKEVPAEQRDRFFQEWERWCEPVELPDHEPRNPERRAERVSAIATDAPERRTEERTRSVSIGREEVKAEAKEYLKQQYVSEGDVSDVICQVCKRQMPFKLDDGSAYFEAVEFLVELKKLHHQNYLALCPNHRAMFRYANSKKDSMLEMFTELTGSELEIVLAQKNETVYFTKTHIADLKKIIEVERSIGSSLNENDTAS